MIRYGDDINDHDILNYWGNGYVLLEQVGVWSMYTLVNIDEDVCTLNKAAEPGLADEGAPGELVLTRDQFFEQAVLHRPALGVVTNAAGNKLMLLSWVPARGNQIKALLSGDVYVSTLCTRKELARHFAAAMYGLDVHSKSLVLETFLLRLEGKCLDADMYKAALAESGHFSYRKKGPQPGGLGMGGANRLLWVISYLNSKDTSLQAAMKIVRDNTFCILCRDWWLWYREGSTYLYTGSVLLGTIELHKNNELTFEPSKVGGDDQTRVLSALGKAILANYNVTIMEGGHHA